jgi:hypothetical protein
VRQVVDDLGADLLQAPQLGHVLDDHPDAADRRASRADDETLPIATANRDLTGGGARLARVPNDVLDAPVDECLDRRPPDHRSCGAVEKDVGSRVCQIDPEIVVDVDDAHADEVCQVGRVASPLLELPVGRVGALDESAHRGDGLARGRVSAGNLAYLIELPAARQGLGEDRRQRDRHRGDERENVPVHGASIAQSIARTA